MKKKIPSVFMLFLFLGLITFGVSAGDIDDMADIYVEPSWIGGDAGETVEVEIRAENIHDRGISGGEIILSFDQDYVKINEIDREGGLICPLDDWISQENLDHEDGLKVAFAHAEKAFHDPGMLYRVEFEFLQDGASVFEVEVLDLEEGLEIVEVDDIDDIEVNYGTEEEEVRSKLPDEVGGQAHDGTDVELEIEWEEHEEYEGEVPDPPTDFIFKGEVLSPWFVPEELSTVEATVTVRGYKVTFEVVDEADEPLEHVEINFYGQIKETDNEGQAVFEDIAPGNYNYKLSKEQYDLQKGVLEIEEDATKTFTLKETILADIYADPDKITGAEGDTAVVEIRARDLHDRGVAGGSFVVTFDHDLLKVIDINREGGLICPLDDWHSEENKKYEDEENGHDGLYVAFVGEEAFYDAGVLYEVTFEFKKGDTQDLDIEKLNLVEGLIYNVTFEVENEDEEALKGALVTFNGVEQLTDEEGKAEFFGAPGTHGYVVTKDGFEDAEGEVEIVDEDVTETVTMEEPDDPAPPPPPDDPAVVTFREINQLEGVAVAVYEDEEREEQVGEEVTTDDTGEADKELEDGAYWFMASRDGYVTYNGTFEVDGENKVVEFELKTGYDLTFRETNELEGVAVTVYEDEELEEQVGREVTTDAAGETVKTLKDGSYWFIASLEGYEFYEGNFEVAGDDKAVEFELESIPEPEKYEVTFREENELEGVTVKVFTDEQLDEQVGMEVITDNTGEATKELADGEYWFTAEKDIYEAYEGDFEVEGSAKSVEFELDIEHVSRLYGVNRFETAVEISQAAFPENADAVVLARGDEFPDALAGVPLAYAKNGPLLLTRSHELPVETENEMERILSAGDTVYILGETAAVHREVEDRLRAMGYEVVRLGGISRFETAVEIANELVPDGPDEVFLTTGLNFADAVSGSSPAARRGSPIVLTRPDDLPEVTEGYLEENADAIGDIQVLGGEAAVEEEVFRDVDGFGDARRIHGINRWETATEIAETFFNQPEIATMATGLEFPDALSGGVFAALNEAPVLLTGTVELPDWTRDYITEEALLKIWIFGGEAAVSDEVEAEVKKILE